MLWPDEGPFGICYLGLRLFIFGLETTSRIMKASLDCFAFLTPFETSTSGVRAWMVGSCLGGGRGSAMGGRSAAGTSRMSSEKKIFPTLLNSESVGTLARLSASAYVSAQ